MDATEALQRLKEGNERFRAGRVTGPGDIASRRSELAKGQQPFAAILSCSDSRLAPEIVFDTSLGDLFVVRVAGNVANPSSIASIEYAVSQLGTKLVVVMAHESCGAVTAAMQGVVASENLGVLLSYIQPALEPPGSVDDIANRNVRNSASRLLERSDILRNATDDGAVRIMTAFFHLSDGAVNFD